MSNGHGLVLKCYHIDSLLDNNGAFIVKEERFSISLNTQNADLYTPNLFIHRHLVVHNRDYKEKDSAIRQDGSPEEMLLLVCGFTLPNFLDPNRIPKARPKDKVVALPDGNGEQTVAVRVYASSTMAVAIHHGILKDCHVVEYGKLSLIISCRTFPIGTASLSAFDMHSQFERTDGEGARARRLVKPTPFSQFRDEVSVCFFALHMAHLRAIGRDPSQKNISVQAIERLRSSTRKV